MRAVIPLVRRSVLVGVTGLGLLLTAACDDGKPHIVVSDAVISAPANPTETAAYLTVTNDGRGPDQLLSIETTAAESAHIHRTRIDERGLATMTPVDRLDLSPHETVEFGPGGYHLMLLQPDAMVDGDTVELTLHFAVSGAERVTAIVATDVTAASR